MSFDTLAPHAATDASGTLWMRTRWLWIACASYLLLRALILYTAFDETALWAYELYMCGTIARSLLGGGGDLPLPYYYDNAAGPVLMALVVAPCYALFGSSYLALKLPALAEGLATVIVTWLLLRRLFDVRAANLAAMLLAFAPTTLTKYTLIGGGNHSENVLFTLLATWSFFEMHARGVSAPRLAVTGLAAGWALAIFIGALTALGLLAIVHLGLRGVKRSLFDVPSTVAGAALGFAPVVWLNLGTGGRGWAFLAAKFGEEGGQRPPFFARVVEFLSVHLPVSSTYPGFLGLPGHAADVLFLVATVAGFLLCAPLALRALVDLIKHALGRASGGDLLSRAFVFCAWAYLPLTVVAYASSNLKIGGYDPPVEAGGYRYFLPHFFYSIVLIAVAASVTAHSTTGWIRRGSIGLCAAPLAAGAFNIGLIDFSFSHPNLGAHYEGHNFARVASTLFSRKLALTPERILEHIESYAPQLRARVYFGAGYYKAVDSKGFLRKQNFELAPVLAAFPTEHRADVARGVGVALRHRESAYKGTRAQDCEQLAHWLATNEPFAQQAVEGLAFDWLYVTSTRTAGYLDDCAALFDQAPATLRPGLAQGIGHACGRLLRREIAADRETILAAIARLPADQRNVALAGLGAGLTDGGEAPRIDAFAVGSLNEADIEPVLAGVAARAREIWSTLPEDARTWIDPTLPKVWREHWERVLAP